MLIRLADPITERLRAPVRRILELQRPDGAIPWFEDGPWDAWNHAESVMALGIAGEHDAALAGLAALSARQLPGGGFFSDYGNALPMADHVHIARVKAPAVEDTNFAAYVATAVLHRHLVLGGSAAFELWPMVRAAIGHVLGRQHPEGDISWCAEAHGDAADDSLVAGNASTYASIGHAILLAELIGDPQPQWLDARARLGRAIRTAPERFDRAGTNRADYAMDWYYPVLAGVYEAADGGQRLEAGWPRFVDAGLGCRCVATEPWVTVAETSELAIAAAAVGMAGEAAALLHAVEQRRDAEGVFWMGWQSVEAIDWPAERPAWTQAAYVLAVDAVEGLTPAAGLFIDG